MIMMNGDPPVQRHHEEAAAPAHLHHHGQELGVHRAEAGVMCAVVMSVTQ